MMGLIGFDDTARRRPWPAGPAPRGLLTACLAAAALLLSAVWSAGLAQEPQEPPPDPEQPAAEAEAAQEPVAEAPRRPQFEDRGQAEDRRHRVRRGDTLWDLARFYMADPFRWPLIYQANRDAIRDPHWIYPDQVFRIPGVPAGAAGGRHAVETAPAVTAPAVAAAVATLSPETRTRFYYGDAPRYIRGPGVGAELRLEAEAREHRGVRPWEYQAAPWLADARRLPIVGRVQPIRDTGPSIGELVDAVRPYERVFVAHGRERPLMQGEELLLVREGERIRGRRVIHPRGVARVEAVHTDGATVQVTRQFGVVQPGDFALPLEPFPGPTGPAESAVHDGPRGRLVALVEDRILHRVADHGFIDLGVAQGLGIGDELTVYLPERRVRGDRVPAERVATVRVVRIGDDHATVRVLSVDYPVLRSGLPVQLVRTVR